MRSSAKTYWILCPGKVDSLSSTPFLKIHVLLPTQNAATTTDLSCNSYPPCNMAGKSHEIRVGASPGIFFRFPGEFFSGYGVYIAKHIRPEAATMRKGFAPLPFYLFCFFFCVLGFFFDSVAGRVVCLFHGANRCIPWLPFIFQSFKLFFGCLVCFSPVFFGFERFCFVLAVFGRVSRDLHTCDH